MFSDCPRNFYYEYSEGVIEIYTKLSAAEVAPLNGNAHCQIYSSRSTTQQTIDNNVIFLFYFLFGFVKHPRSCSLCFIDLCTLCSDLHGNVPL